MTGAAGVDTVGAEEVTIDGEAVSTGDEAGGGEEGGVVEVETGFASGVVTIRRGMPGGAPVGSDGAADAGAGPSSDAVTNTTELRAGAAVAVGAANSISLTEVATVASSPAVTQIVCITSTVAVTTSHAVTKTMSRLSSGAAVASKVKIEPRARKLE